MKAYMYILACADGSYYTGSTTDLVERIHQHEIGIGANFTSKKLPVKLVYLEEFDRIEYAFRREKQIQKWSKAKKKALIEGDYEKLKASASCKNETNSKNYSPYSFKSRSPSGAEGCR